MQRSIFDKNSVTTFIYVAIFMVYTALSGIYLFLPPFLAILFILFSKALKKNDAFFIFSVVFCLVIFEAQNGYALFSTIIYFSIVYKYIMPTIIKNSSCYSCIKFATVVLVYIGFFLFHSLLSNVFLLPIPNIDYYVIYYIIIEFLIVSIL